MRILSVVRIKAYSRYGYDYLSEIILRRADFQEHTIAEKDFKNLYPIDFEDLNLLILQGHLDHLPGSDKRMLSTAVKLWTRNLVIQQRVKDFKLGIKSYQTQLNLTKPGWDATCFEFKHDYTIIESPRAVVFPVDNNDQKIIRFNEIYKFSDGTLTRILEALDYIVKEFKVNRLNPGMNTRLWTEKDVTRSKEFIETIERRLKTRRIYWNLECFVGGRVLISSVQPSLATQDPQRILFHFSWGLIHFYLSLSSELDDIEKTRAKASSKRAREDLEQESSKKQKVDDDKETAELQRLIEVVLDKEEVAIDAISFATKPPSIVD
ncbi:hypothetical protein Tco_1095092 [Tanacetum coccineum]